MTGKRGARTDALKHGRSRTGQRHLLVTRHHELQPSTCGGFSIASAAGDVHVLSTHRQATRPAVKGWP